MGSDELSFRTLRRGGPYRRVADPAWVNPLDGSFSRSQGGRWNAPGRFAVVYLNATLAVARANVLRKFRGLPYGPEDLEPAAAPVLVTTEVPEDDFVDVVTDAGCQAVGLPSTYPRGARDEVGWPACQAVGRQAWDAGAPGVACRSAAPGVAQNQEELAWFERDVPLAPDEIQPFDDWFWP